MSRRNGVFLMILLIGLAFFGILAINNQRLQEKFIQDNNLKTISPSIAMVSGSPSLIPTLPVVQPTTTQAFYCDKDSDCGFGGTCIEKTECPPCLDGDPYATCTCTTTKTCQNNIGACTNTEMMSINTGAPFKPGIEEARIYFNQNGLRVNEELTKVIGSNNAYYVVHVPKGQSNIDWVKKLKNDGFSDVTYYQIIGCDEVGY